MAQATEDRSSRGASRLSVFEIFKQSYCLASINATIGPKLAGAFLQIFGERLLSAPNLIMRLAVSDTGTDAQEEGLAGLPPREVTVARSSTPAPS